MIDQEAFLEKVEEWKRENPTTSIYFRPKCSSKDNNTDKKSECETKVKRKSKSSHYSPLFIYQEQLQKRLLPLCKNCPYSELFWSAFSYIRIEYGEIRSIFPYSVRVRENTDQNKSVYYAMGTSWCCWMLHIAQNVTLCRYSF